MTMFGRIRGFLCRRGLHSWEFVGWATYGRGRLEQCRRTLSSGDRCPAVRTLPIETRLLEQVLKTDLAKITGRPKPDQAKSDQVETQGFEIDLETQIKSIHAVAESQCQACHRWISPSSTYCIKCGSGRIKN